MSVTAADIKAAAVAPCGAVANQNRQDEALRLEVLRIVGTEIIANYKKPMSTLATVVEWVKAGTIPGD